jgi:glutathione gamma-glutamylcysteinyltransferase
VLLLDAARFKYPPHWISLSLLFSAMKPIDPQTNKSRGYFIMGKSLDDCTTHDPNICKTQQLNSAPCKEVEKILIENKE